MWFVGGTAPAAFEGEQAHRHPGAVESQPSAPVPEPTLKAAVTSMSAAVLDLLGKK